MELRLQKATLRDIPEISFLAKLIWEKHYVPLIGSEQVEYMLSNMYSSQSLKEQMEQKKHVFYLVHLENKCLGFVSISSSDHKNYLLHKIYLLQDEQNRGLGTAVFKLILEEMGSPGSIRLTVNRMNYKSINFYFKNGFRIEKTEDFDIGNGYFMNDFVMCWSK
ncbi:MAG: GNAT family N-acetyltransferase [Bacteroidia bacterium]